MTLQSGTYSPRNQVKVTVWPKPDKNGDGEDAYVDVKDDAGSFLGREPLLEDGQQVRHYEPPEGFMRVPTVNPGADGATEAVVRDNGRGRVHRNAQGHAVGITPGSALVEYPDGTHVLLTDGYSQRQFELAHERVGDATEEVTP